MVQQIIIIYIFQELGTEFATTEYLCHALELKLPTILYLEHMFFNGFLLLYGRSFFDFVYFFPYATMVNLNIKHHLCIETRCSWSRLLVKIAQDAV